MKKFQEFISEEILPFAQTEKGFVGIDNGPVRDNINLLLANVTTMPYSTPYHALEAVRKALISFHISLPATNFLDGDAGQEAFPINQFGKKMGILPSGEVVTQTPSSYYVYFEYAMNETGSFDIFCEVVDEDELQEIMADVEADEVDYESEDASDSYDSYKMKNAIAEQIVYRGDDKESAQRRKIMLAYHTKKSKKTLPSMQKEEAINEVSKQRLGAYIKQAADDKATAGIDYEKTKKSRHPVKKEVAADNLKRYQKRTKGISMAVKKLTKEENLDEVSRDMLSRYIKKAKSSSRDAYYGDDAPTSGKRKKGIDLALKKKWGDKNHGTPEPKVKATNEENLNELSKEKLGQYIKKASHDVATKSAAVGRYADRANKARDKMKKGDYSDWQQGKKDDEFADKMFKKSWNRRKGIAKATDKLVKEDDAPFDNPTKKPSTPYKNPAAKSKQLARAAMKQVQAGKDERKRLIKSLREKPKKK